MPRSTQASPPVDRFSVALNFQRAGRTADAERVYREILCFNPDDPDAMHLLGVIADQSGGRDAEAERLMRRSLELAPHVADFHNNYAGLLQKSGRPREAEEHLRTAITLRPAYPEACNNLGVSLDRLGRVGEAIKAFESAIALRGPAGYPEALHNLAVIQESVGLATEALATWRTAAQLNPSQETLSSLLICLHYTRGDDGALMLREHLRWAEVHAGPLRPHIRPHPNNRDRERKLRVGYLSADFRSHPVAHFAGPILAAHDREKVTSILYCNCDPRNPIGLDLREVADGFREIENLDDERAVAQIRADRIDILVNLTGHMPNGRMTLMALKPAPVQVNYIGYPNTFGLDTVEYRITDEWHDPPELRTEQHHVERLVRIPGGCWCYGPVHDSPDVRPVPPFKRTGRFTFALPNRLVKVTDPMIGLWRRILMQVPDADLLVTGPDDQLVWQRFAANGIPPERMRIRPRGNMQHYLQGFHEADILLDTFPHGGHTTTCDAAWMGVPTVTLGGKTSVSQAGVSILTSLGLEGLIARTPDEYVNIAVQVAGDRESLAQLRSTLRRRMIRSPLMNAARLTKELERAYRDMWRTWCDC